MTASKQPERAQWALLPPEVRAEFASRVVAGEKIGAIRAAMPALAGLSSRTLALRARAVREVAGLVRAALPSPTVQERAAWLADRALRKLCDEYGRAMAYEVVGAMARRVQAARRRPAPDAAGGADAGGVAAAPPGEAAGAAEAEGGGR